MPVADQRAAGRLRICIVGGSAFGPGGVEIFSARAHEALERHRPQWRTVLLPADTGHLRPRGVPALVRALAAFVRVRREGLDLLWLQVSNLPDLLYLLLARALGVRVLATPHLGANSRLQRSAVLRRICTGLLGRADRIALLFDGQEREIELPVGVPRSVIRTLLPARSFDPIGAARVSAPPLRLVHAARLSEGKGSFQVVDVCAQLKRLGCAFSARIVGSADDATLARLGRHIAEQGLSGQVVLAGWMDERELLAELRRADVLVHLSTLDSYPLIVLEAMASGVLPVVLDMAGVGVMVDGYDGHVVAPGGAARAAAGWLAAQDLAALRRRGRAAGERVRADFAWPVAVDRIDAAIGATLSRSGG